MYVFGMNDRKKIARNIYSAWDSKRKFIEMISTELKRNVICVECDEK